MSDAIVYIVDDDENVREALQFLLKSVGQACALFASGPDFLQQYCPDQHGCIVCDIRMPGMSGLELQQELVNQGSSTPIIFITGHGDIPMAVEAIKSGAQEFLTKPFRDQVLLDAIHTAITLDAQRRSSSDVRAELEARKRTLTRRERQVFDLVVAGQTNKAIADELHLSHRTIEVHRSHMMEKMGAQSLPQLLKLAQDCTD